MFNPIPVDEGFRPQSKIVYETAGVQCGAKVMPDIEKAIKFKNKRKTSIEGDTIGELVNNIIKEKPSIKLVSKAFQKIVDILEDERDQIDFLI